MAERKYLEDIYFDPSHAGSFSGVEKLYQTVRKEGKFKIGRKKYRKVFAESRRVFASKGYQTQKKEKKGSSLRRGSSMGS